MLTVYGEITHWPEGVLGYPLDFLKGTHFRKLLGPGWQDDYTRAMTELRTLLPGVLTFAPSSQCTEPSPKKSSGKSEPIRSSQVNS